MITTACSLLIIATLSIMVVQDFRDRAIDWYLFPIGFFLILTVADTGEQGFTWRTLLLNLMIIGSQLSLLWIYFFLTGRKLNLWSNDHLGFGDILFLFILAVSFSPVNFFFFYFFSLLFAILIFFLISLSPKKWATIPLAGIQAFLLIIVFVLGWVWKSDVCYDDTYIINLMLYGNG